MLKTSKVNPLDYIRNRINFHLTNYVASSDEVLNEYQEELDETDILYSDSTDSTCREAHGRIDRPSI